MTDCEYLRTQLRRVLDDDEDSDDDTLLDLVAELKRALAATPATWECGCGTRNGLNLAVCGVCLRTRAEGQISVPPVSEELKP